NRKLVLSLLDGDTGPGLGQLMDTIAQGGLHARVQRNNIEFRPIGFGLTLPHFDARFGPPVNSTVRVARTRRSLPAPEHVERYVYAADRIRDLRVAGEIEIGPRLAGDLLELRGSHLGRPAFGGEDRDVLHMVDGLIGEERPLRQVD